MNKTPLLCFVFDRKKKANSKKEGPVELRITYMKKQKYLSTGVRLLPRQWQMGMVRLRPDADELTAILNQLLKDVRSVIADMQERGYIDIDKIPDELERRKNKGMSFIEFAESRLEIRKYGRAEDSQERYDRFMRFFIQWGKIEYFSDITEANIIQLDTALKNKGLKNYSKWNNYHRFLNSFIIDAINEGYLTKNPYKHVNIVKDKTSHGTDKYLTPEEFEKIKNVIPTIPSLARVRDLFVFQTYTCLSYTDLASFDPDLIQDFQGKKFYVGKRGKTKQQFTFLLMKPALDILKKYGGRLPVISNVKYNQYLKALAMMAGINKPVSSHWARHTGATLLLNEGKLEMEVIAKILGHSSTRITRQVYAKMLDETVINAMADIDNGF